MMTTKINKLYTQLCTYTKLFQEKLKFVSTGKLTK